MKCYRHPQSDAVATCKYCSKGVCTECAKDTGVGIVCSATCEVEVRSLKALEENSKRLLPLASRTHRRNAVLFTLFGAVFITFSLIDRNDSFLFPFLLAAGVVILIGAGFSFLTGRRYAKSVQTQA